MKRKSFSIMSGSGFGGFGGPTTTGTNPSGARIVRLAQGGYGPAPDLSTYPQIPARSQPLPLDPRPYRARFEEMVEDLSSNRNVFVEFATFGEEPVEQKEIDRVRREGKVVPEALATLYKQFNGFKMKWSVIDDFPGKEKNNALTGRCNLLPFDQIFGTEWFADDPYEKGLIPIDLVFDEAYACLSMTTDAMKNNGDPKISWKTSSVLHPKTLDLTYASYIELLLRSRGFFFWQGAVWSDIDGEEATVEPASFRMNMPKIFGDDFDLKFFLRRAEELCAIDAKKLDEQQEKEVEVRAAIAASGAEVTLLPCAASSTFQITFVSDDGGENDRKVFQLACGLGMSTRDQFSGETKDPTTYFKNFGAAQFGKIMLTKVARGEE